MSNIMEFVFTTLLIHEQKAIHAGSLFVVYIKSRRYIFFL